MASTSSNPLKSGATGTFIPPEHEAWYYKHKTPSVHHESAFTTTFVHPWFPPEDPTHGRHDLPYSPREDEIRNNTKDYHCWGGKIHMRGSQRDWIVYQVS